MIKVDSKVWEISDPDEILSLTEKVFDMSLLGVSKKIYPREDLLQLTNRNNNLIIDFGNYGCESSTDGNWMINVIDLNIQDPWDNQLECYSFVYSDFMNAIKLLNELVNKYT